MEENYGFIIPADEFNSKKITTKLVQQIKVRTILAISNTTFTSRYFSVEKCLGVIELIRYLVNLRVVSLNFSILLGNGGVSRCYRVNKLSC